MKRAMAAGRETIVARMPEGVRRRLGPGARYVHMLLVDHLFIRLAFTNRHEIGDGIWRSAQPLPHHIRQLSGMGVKTIVNLRGKTKTSTYAIEKAACERHAMAFIDFPMKSRAAPTRAEILAARDLFVSVQYPMLMHCKSGADRAGLMSALYLHFIRGVPVEEARRELSLRYGHFRQADTGILDEVFDRYLADTASRPISFLEWVETVYDPAELQRSFRAKSWANRIVRGVLRRE